MEDRHARRGRRARAGSLATALGGLLIVALGSAGCTDAPARAPYDHGEQEVTRMRFDPAGWANEKTAFDPPYARRAMVDDVMRSVAKAGTPRADVERMLGATRDTNKFADHDLVYFIGPQPGLGVDSQWLLIDFDDAGRVASATLAGD